MELKENVRNDGITEIALIGRLDVVGLQRVETRFFAFTAAARRNTILDLAGLEFIASLGIGMLISSAKTLWQHGAKMVLVNPRPDVDAVLRMTGIDNAIPIVASIADAEALLAARG
jgi:anti-sigma B factor antagonist